MKRRRLLRAAFVLILFLAPGGGSGALSGGEAPSSVACAIPAGAIRIPVPGVVQPDDYSCGAASLMSVCSYYGVGPKKIGRFKKKVHANEFDGTSYRDMIAYARKLGLRVECKIGMTFAELDDHLKRGRPVICAIQAYADCPENYDDPGDNEAGHYVVAIGMAGDHYYFMDPSLPGRRGCLSRSAFEKRWHDDEGTLGSPRICQHLGMAIFPPEQGTPFLNEALPID